MIRLYALPGSHPCAVVEHALRAKGLEYKRRELLPLTQVLIGPLAYGGTTVPGMRIGRERIVGSRKILRRLDELAPDPPLLPADPAQRELVLEAERWGDEEFQAVPRRILDVLFLRDPAAMLSYAEGAQLPLPTALLKPALPLTARLMARKNHANDSTVGADLAALSRQLDRIDAWIADGVLGGEAPNAADLQIGSSIQLLLSCGDIVPLIAERPAAALARYFATPTGSVPAGLLPRELLAA